MKKTIAYRPFSNDTQLEKLSDYPVLDRIYRSRGINSPSDLDRDLQGLLPYASLKNMDLACDRLVRALENQESIVIIGDFDADGATSTTIAVRALRMMGGKKIQYLVPNRFKYGYGLTPEIVEVAREQGVQLIVTVDNGIASHAGVSYAQEKQIDVIITDHHLAAETLPNACAIVNPNQPGDEFASKCIAGCGVIFYVMLALRAKLREKNWFIQHQIAVPNMADLLDIVALGTVADVVSLDKNNRILVHQGLRRIRAEKCVPGIKALLTIAKRDLKKIAAVDLGFAVAPRLNAAGRLDDMSIGIECLLTDDVYMASKLAAQLDGLNQERKLIEQEMKEQAFSDLAKVSVMHKADHVPVALCLFDQQWHQGVIGILAARLKEHWHRPVIIFARGDEGEIKGSARSIQGVHIRDVFQLVDIRYPNLIKKFGGHAMAAGLTIDEKNFEAFKSAFLDVVSTLLHDVDLENKILCDGELKQENFNVDFAAILKEGGPWGQHFPEPIFANRFKIADQRLVGEKHLKLSLLLGNQFIDAIYFNIDLKSWPNYRCEAVLAAYRLDVNEFRGKRNVQLLIDHLEPILLG